MEIPVKGFNLRVGAFGKRAGFVIMVGFPVCLAISGCPNYQQYSKAGKAFSDALDASSKALQEDVAKTTKAYRLLLIAKYLPGRATSTPPSFSEYVCSIPRFEHTKDSLSQLGPYASRLAAMSEPVPTDTFALLKAIFISTPDDPGDIAKNRLSKLMRYVQGGDPTQQIKALDELYQLTDPVSMVTSYTSVADLLSSKDSATQHMAAIVLAKFYAVGRLARTQSNDPIKGPIKRAGDTILTNMNANKAQELVALINGMTNGVKRKQKDGTDIDIQALSILALSQFSAEATVMHAMVAMLTPLPSPEIMNALKQSFVASGQYAVEYLKHTYAATTTGVPVKNLILEALDDIPEDPDACEFVVQEWEKEARFGLDGKSDIQTEAAPLALLPKGFELLSALNDGSKKILTIVNEYERARQFKDFIVKNADAIQYVFSSWNKTELNIAYLRRRRASILMPSYLYEDLTNKWKVESEAQLLTRSEKVHEALSEFEAFRSTGTPTQLTAKMEEAQKKLIDYAAGRITFGEAWTNFSELMTAAKDLADLATKAQSDIGKLKGS